MTRRTSTNRPSTALPSNDDRRIAGEASRRLATLPAPTARLEIHSAREAVEIPAAVLPLLRQLLDHIAAGHPVAIVEDEAEAELSTQQAANSLGVSRPFLVALLERGAIPFRKVGAHRRVRVRDLLDYKRNDQAERLGALDELAAQAQELGLGY
jgi:excisionase family DNA binding protein